MLVRRGQTTSIPIRKDGQSKLDVIYASIKQCILRITAGSYALVNFDNRITVPMPEIIPNLHPLVVHFPIALTFVAAIFLLAARFRSSDVRASQWAVVGHWALWLSALSAVVTALFGWQAFGTVNHDDAGHLAMKVHLTWAVSTTIVLVIVAIIDGWRSQVDRPASWGVTIMVAFLVGAIAVTGWLGGEVVFRHGVGVRSMPAMLDATAGHGGHDHAHPQMEEIVPTLPKSSATTEHHHADVSMHKH